MLCVWKSSIEGVGNMAMDDSWLEQAINEATGNVTPYEEFKVACFDVFRKLQENGYPDMIIMSMVCDSTKMPMTIPALFDEWRSEQ